MISPTYQSAINVWSKNLPELGNIKNPEKIEDIPWANDLNIIDTIEKFIEETYSNINSRKKHLCALLYILNETELQQKTHEIRDKIGELLQQTMEKEKDNEQDEHEKLYFKSYDELIRIRHQLSHRRNKSFEDNMTHLLLCMYVDTPPIRTEYMNIDIVKGNFDAIGEKNAIHITEGNRVWLYIGNDKVSNLPRPALYYRLPNTLALKIRESLEKYPRDKLILPRQDATKTTTREFYDLMNNISPHMGVSLLRSSYITNFYKSNPSRNQKEELARKMRHSVNTAEIHYNKVFV